MIADRVCRLATLRLMRQDIASEAIVGGTIGRVWWWLDTGMGGKAAMAEPGLMRSSRQTQ